MTRWAAVAARFLVIGMVVAPSIAHSQVARDAEADSLATQPIFDLELHGGSDDPGVGSGWITPAAAADSVAVFWGAMDRQWHRDLPRGMDDFPLDTARVDSLSEVGCRKIDEMLTGSLWRLDWRKISDTGFSRVEGSRVETGLLLRRLGPTGPELKLSTGYCLASRRIVGSGEFSTVLKLKRPVDVIGRPTNRFWPLLALEAAGGKEAFRYAGDDQALLGKISAALTGVDSGRYYERQGGHAKLVLRPWRHLALQAGVLIEEHESLPVAMTWSLFGDKDDVDDNPAVDELYTRALTLGADWRWRHLFLEAGAQWHRVTDSPLAGDYRRWRADLSWNHIDRWGDELLLRGHWQSWDRNVPAQWKTWLGDSGTLRGFAAREIAGDQALWGSVDLRSGRDIFRDLHIPLLKNLGLQPIAFVDWGRTVVLDGPSIADAAEGWRADAGLGLGMLLGVPGADGYLRCYVARPAFGSEGGRNWRVVLSFEN